MKLDNSRMVKWFYCPDAYRERYIEDIEPVRKVTYAYGTRVHELTESYHRGLMGQTHVPRECPDEAVELEAQTMLAAYKAHYPIQVDANGREFEFVNVEQFFEVPLPGDKHTYIGEFDGVVRMKDTGGLKLFETKSEKRNSKANLPEAWVVRPQVGLYLWAAQQVYGEPFEGIILNVMTRQSPKGEFGPTFRRDNLERTPEQMEKQVGQIVWVADQIEKAEAEFGKDGPWPRNCENCVNSMTGWRCDYYPLHTFGREPVILAQYQKAEEYLAL